MSSSGNRTPVSILNEYLIQKGEPAKYDLMFNGSGSENPIFVYAVHYDGLTALGRGRSKQEAKHEAAKQMLEYLNISSEYSQGNVNELVLPHENNIGYNAVGILNDYCIRQFYPEAVYSVISEKGPPHAKIFTIKCCVSHLSTVGIARTKKQAKQIAAHKMVMQLQDEAGEKPMAIALPKKVPSQEPLNSGVKPINLHKPQALLYKDFCNAYLNVPERSETLTEFLKTTESDSSENAFHTLQKIAEELAVDLLVERVGKKGSVEKITSFTNLNGEETPHVFKVKPEKNINSLREIDDDDIDVVDVDYVNCDDSFEYCPIIDSENIEITFLDPIIVMSLMINPPVVSIGYNISEASIQLLGYLRILCN